MRIRCPACAATYEVADAMLDPPRTVRCARCSHDWTAVPVADAPAPEPQVAAEVEPEVQPREPGEPEIQFREPAAPAARLPPPEIEAALGDTPLSAIERLSSSVDLSPRIYRRDRLLTAAWAASFAALAALGVAGYTKRDALMRQWPASKRVYATLGLAPLDATTADGKDKEAKGATGRPASQ